MKTAISLPDDLFEAVERVVRRSKRHRSEVYADAPREYVARHSPDEVTEAMNAVVNRLDESREERGLTDAVARRTLANSEW